MRLSFARLLALAFLPLLLTGCGLSKIENQAKIQADLGEALRQAQIDQTAAARKWADRAIAVDPKDVNTYIDTRVGPSNEPRLSIAAVFSSVGDDPTLTDYMRRAVRQFPDAYQPLQALVDAEGRLGQEAEKKADAAKLAALLEGRFSKPGANIGADVMNVLAQAYWDAGNRAKGIETYRRAIDAYRDDPNAYNGLAYAFAVENSKPDLPEAQRLAQKSLDLARRQHAQDEFIGAVQDTLGWVQYRMGDYKDALYNVQQGVNANPRLAEGRYHLAMVYLAMGDTDAARSEFTHATLLSKGYAAAQAALERLKSTAPSTRAGKNNGPPRRGADLRTHPPA